MTTSTHGALAPRALRRVLTACVSAPQLPGRASSCCCCGPFRAARMARVGATPSLTSATLGSWNRCASSTGFSKNKSPPQLPRSHPVPPSSASTQDTATSGWVSTRKSNGEQRMSISIRSTAQRQLARQQSPATPSSSASLHGTASPPPRSPASAGERKSEQASSSQASEKQEVVPKTILDNTHSSSGATAPPPFSTSSDQRSSKNHKRVHSTSTLTSKSPSPASSPSSGGAQALSSPLSALSPTTGASTSGQETERERPHDAAPSTASSSAAGSAGTANSQRTAASHSLLYSVSSFTEPVKRIILIRNGRSEANEDVRAYVQTPDWRIPLVEEGKREAIAAGRALSGIIGDDPVYFYYSPYIRSRQSLRYVLQGFDEGRLSGLSHSKEWWEEEETTGAVSATATAEPLTPKCATPSADEAGGSPLLATAPSAISTNATSTDVQGCFHGDPSLVLNRGTSNNIIGVREDVRLRDGDIGRYTSADELMHHLVERERYGRFFYRFPFGESGADVCDRVTSFLDAFQRERVEFPMDTSVVIITHGLTMRMFIKRWFYLTVDTFHKMKSPPPGSLCTLTRLHHRSCFRLDECCVESMNLPLSLNEFNGYKYRNKQLLGSMSSGAPYM
ncbi:phosphoglycerate mutase, putative [Leishmania tarentolae]|uniref:Phosphoglycerate mutase, putative n=1 Tax=Leishmania tarentolae TaxID=5689 RepID=A0A640KS77_LEITA|nr:phosphoglycerate mutase, putative [Leishmania tarentolae]